MRLSAQKSVVIGAKFAFLDWLNAEPTLQLRAGYERVCVQLPIADPGKLSWHIRVLHCWD